MRRLRGMLRAITATPVRVLAVIRLGALPVFLAGDLLVEHPSPRTAGFGWVLALAALYAVAAFVLAFAERRRPPGWLFAAVDLALICALVYTSGGPFSELRLAFFLLPISAALLLGPQLTAAASLVAIVAYLGISLPYDESTSTAAARNDPLAFEVTQILLLAWMGGAATLLSRLLARRADEVQALAVSRGRLVAQALDAEDRARRRLAEALHDEAIQNLLAARQELRAGMANGGGDLELVQLGLDRTVSQLREAVFDLHPYLLEHGGLAAALEAVVAQQARRAGFEGEVSVDESATGRQDPLVFALARELIVNAARHSGARHLTVTVRRQHDALVLEVADDGRGADPERVRSAALSGHIGLASSRERVEALGGCFELVAAPGEGTRVRAQIPLAAEVGGADGGQRPRRRAEARRRALSRSGRAAS